MTVAPEVWAAAVVPFAPRTQPVNVFVDLPEYVIDSESITIVPDVEKDAAEVKTIEVVFETTGVEVVYAYAVVPLVPRVQPVKDVLVVPVYVISSRPIHSEPVGEANPVVDATLMVVADAEINALNVVPTSEVANVVVVEPDVVPPQVPAPQPVATV